MKKLIITYEGNISPIQALTLVTEVVKIGRISEKRIDGELVKHYCWVTKFIDDTKVIVRDKKTKYSADSFHVYKTT